MAEKSTGLGQFTGASTALMPANAAIPSRQFVDSHLEKGHVVPIERVPTEIARPESGLVFDSVRSVLQTDRTQNRRLLDQTQRDQGTLRVNEQIFKEFAGQEKNTATRVADVKTLVGESKGRVTALEAQLLEYNKSWAFWRSFTKEKDTILQGLAREKELLKAHEERLKIFNARQDEFQKTKTELISLTKGSNSQRASTASRERVLSSLRAQSEGLDNLMALDIYAMQTYQDSRLSDRPLNAWEKLRGVGNSSFRESKAGRFLIGVGTIASTVASAIKSAAVAVGDFLTDSRTWEKAWDGIKWGAAKGWDGIKWVADKVGDGAKWALTKTWNGIKAFSEKVFEYIKHPEKLVLDAIDLGWSALKAVGNGLVSAGKWILKAAQTVGTKALDYILHPMKLIEDIYKCGCAICSGIKTGFNYLTKAISFVVNFHLDIIKAFGRAIKFLATEALDLITHPAKLLKFIKDGLNLLGNTLCLAGEFLVDPNSAWGKLCKSVDNFMTKACDKLGLGLHWNICKKLLGFIKDLSDSLGITDIIAGVANLATLTTRSIYQAGKAMLSVAKHLYNFTMGKESINDLTRGVGDAAKDFGANMKEGLSQSCRLFRGVYHLTMECTGLADIGRGIGCALKGDWAAAGMYFGLGLANLGALALTVFTAGAGVGAYLGVAAIKKSLQRASIKLGQECLAIVGKEMGEVIAKEFVEKVGMETLKKEAVIVADKLVTKCAEQGLALDTIEGMTKAIAKDHFKEVLTKSGLGDIVEERVKKTLQVIIDHPTPKGLKKALTEMPELANLSKKEIKAARKMLVSGEHFDDIVKTLTKEITDSVHAKIGPELEETFAKRLRASLLGEVDSPAAKKLAAQIDKEAAAKGVSKSELAEEYVTKARKGFREGLREAIEEIVEAAVRRALKSLKYPKESWSYHMIKREHEQRQAEEKEHTKILAKLEKQLNHEEKKAKILEQKKEELDPVRIKLTRTERVVIDGKVYSALFEQLDHGEWKNRGMTFVEEERKALAAVSKAEADIESKIIKVSFSDHKEKAA